MSWESMRPTFRSKVDMKLSEAELQNVEAWEEKYKWPALSGKPSTKRLQVMLMRYQFINQAHKSYPKLAIKYKNLLIDYLRVLKQVADQKIWFDNYHRGFEATFTMICLKLDS